MMLLQRNCMKLCDRISIISGLAAIAVFSPSIALTLSAQQIQQISQNVTIQIRGKDGTWGSGIIVKQHQDIYYALTSLHVIDNPTTYTIIAPDRQTYYLDEDKVERDRSADIAVLKFKSQKNYKIAKLGNSSTLKIGTPLYINGFIKDKLGLRLLFRSGEVIANSNGIDKYGLIYTNNSLPGMSGGGVFDRNGELVGIQCWGEANKFYHSSETAIAGNARGVAINNILQLKLLNLRLSVPAQKTAIAPRSDDFYVEGLKHQKRQNYREAIAAYTRAVKAYPQYTYAYYKRGDSYYQQGKYRHSYQDFSRALKFGLNHPDVYNYRGLSRYKLGDFSGAIDDYTSALRLDSNYYYAYANRADISYILKRYLRAIKDYTTAINYSFEPQYLYLNRGYALYELEKIDSAIKDWRRSRRLLPQDRQPSVDLAIAVSLYQKGERVKALELAELSLIKQSNLAKLKTIKALGWGDRLLSDAQKLFRDPRMQNAIQQIEELPSKNSTGKLH